VICYMKDYEIDYHEGDRGKVFKMNVMPAYYFERNATENILDNNPKYKAKISKAIKEKGIKYYIKNSIPSVIFVMVSIISSRDRILAVQRSKLLDSQKGIWVLGPCETMMLKNQSGEKEDLFDLVERALYEEFGLGKNDYGEINISSMYIYLKSLALTVYAQVRLKISEDATFIQALNAPSNYENANFDWIKINRMDFEKYISSKSGNLATKNWHDNTSMGLLEILRCKRYV